MLDPSGIANWSVTHVDWSEKKWHPKAYTSRDVSYDLLRNIAVRIALPYLSILRAVLAIFLSLFSVFLQSITESVHITSETKV